MSRNTKREGAIKVLTFVVRELGRKPERKAGNGENGTVGEQDGEKNFSLFAHTVNKTGKFL